MISSSFIDNNIVHGTGCCWGKNRALKTTATAKHPDNCGIVCLSQNKAENVEKDMKHSPPLCCFLIKENMCMCNTSEIHVYPKLLSAKISCVYFVNKFYAVCFSDIREDLVQLFILARNKAKIAQNPKQVLEMTA